MNTRSEVTCNPFVPWYRINRRASSFVSQEVTWESGTSVFASAGEVPPPERIRCIGTRRTAAKRKT